MAARVNGAPCKATGTGTGSSSNSSSSSSSLLLLSLSLSFSLSLSLSHHPPLSSALPLLLLSHGCLAVAFVWAALPVGHRIRAWCHTQSAIFDFQSLLIVLLLMICTCAYLRSLAPATIDKLKDGYARPRRARAPPHPLSPVHPHPSPLASGSITAACFVGLPSNAAASEPLA